MHFKHNVLATEILLTPGVNVDFSQHRFELDLKVNINYCFTKSVQLYKCYHSCIIHVSI